MIGFRLLKGRIRIKIGIRVRVRVGVMFNISTYHKSSCRQSKCRTFQVLYRLSKKMIIKLSASITFKIVN